jgi:hypothetical protein
MDTLKYTQSIGANRLAAHLSNGYATLGAGIGKLLRRAQDDAQIESAASATAAEAATIRAAQLFAQALQEESNLELDWLWYAVNMTTDVQRRYCFRRALAINPDSELAKRALAQLPPTGK